MEGVAVGIDVAKDFHWVPAVDRADSERCSAVVSTTRRRRSPGSSSGSLRWLTVAG
jgi:hypothetical protein